MPFMKKVANKRSDFLHKDKLVSQHDTLFGNIKLPI